MKRSIIYSVVAVVAALFVVSSCQKQLGTDLLTKDDIGEYSYDEVLAKWSSFKSHDEKVAATQIPEEYLTQMSTKSLLNTTLNNPLMSDYLFFDNPIDGIIVFSTSFNGTKELLKRDDAKDCLLEKLCLEEPEIAEAGFVELFTGAYVDSLGISKEEVTKYLAAADKRITFLKDHRETYSFYSIRKTLFLESRLQEYLYDNLFNPRVTYDNLIFEHSLMTKSYTLLDTITVYTYYGAPIEGLILQEMSDSEKLANIQYVSNNYPNAIILSQPTTAYNCHSYAWNMQNGGDTCWINTNSMTNSSNVFANDNISKYWQQWEYYTSASTFNTASIVTYNSPYVGGDFGHVGHSARVEGNLLVSKWGAGPLVKHNIADCPYPSSEPYYTTINYFKVATYPIYVLISGPGVQAVGEPETYSILDQSLGLTYNWAVYNTNDRPFTYSINPSNKNCTVTINRSGEYLVECLGYYGNRCVIYGNDSVNVY